MPALAVQPPQQDPLSSYAKAVQLKGLLQEQQLRQQLAPGQMQAQQQQIQAQGLENQQRQYQLSQTQAVNQAYRDALKVGSDGTPSIDTNSLSQSLAQSGHGEAIPGILKNTADYQKSMADAVKAQQDVQSSFNDALGNVGSAIQKANYDPNLADVLLQHQIQMPGIPPQYAQRLQQIDQQIRQNPQMVKQIADQLVATSSEQQKFQNALQVAGVRANTPDAQALAAFLRANPDKTAADFPAFKSQQEALAQNSPQVVAGKANAAGAEAAARVAQENSPTAVQGAVNKAVAIQNALTSGSNAALAGVPPHLVAPATAAAQKAGEAFTQAQQAANDLQDMVDLAKQGNKVAYAYSPVTGVLQINVAGQTKRINTTEIEQYGGAGSALDRLKAFVGKETEGKSIPDNILNDMANVSSSYLTNAQKKYQGDLDLVNQNYGSKFTAPKSVTQPNSAPAHKVGDTIVQNGHSYTVDEVDANGKVTKAH